MLENFAKNGIPARPVLGQGQEKRPIKIPITHFQTVSRMAYIFEP